MIEGEDEVLEENYDIITQRKPFREDAEDTFQSFLQDDSTRKIKILGITIDFFYTIPIEDYYWRIHYNMRECMPLLEETLLVFDDNLIIKNAAL
jgi:hypothetical protein